MSFFLEMPKRDEEEEDEREDGEEEEDNVENTSDEGIDDGDSESGAVQNDYLTSSVSKTDLELMSKFV